MIGWALAWAWATCVIVGHAAGVLGVAAFTLSRQACISAGATLALAHRAYRRWALRYFTCDPLWRVRATRFGCRCCWSVRVDFAPSPSVGLGRYQQELTALTCFVWWDHRARRLNVQWTSNAGEIAQRLADGYCDRSGGPRKSANALRTA